MAEASCGSALFTTNDLEAWKWALEMLGRVCAEAWHDDLPEADRVWAEAHRKNFERWIKDSRPDGIDTTMNVGSNDSCRGASDEELAVPWPMLLEAVKSAFFAFLVKSAKEKSESDHRTVDSREHLEQTSLWRALNADDIDKAFQASALRAFRRGFRRGRRGFPSSLTRRLVPNLEPPAEWMLYLKNVNLPGPSAARDRALMEAQFKTTNLKELKVLDETQRELYASAWREDVPEEDREWAETYRRACSDRINKRRRNAMVQSAYEAYLRSSDGIFNGEPAEPWLRLSGLISKAWRSFTDRVDDAPEGESELKTTEAAVREYWDTFYQEAPPWDGNPAQAHWLAAVRAARKAAADYLQREKLTRGGRASS